MSDLVLFDIECTEVILNQSNCELFTKGKKYELFEDLDLDYYLIDNNGDNYYLNTEDALRHFKKI